MRTLTRGKGNKNAARKASGAGLVGVELYGQVVVQSAGQFVYLIRLVNIATEPCAEQFFLMVGLLES